MPKVPVMRAAVARCAGLAWLALLLAAWAPGVGAEPAVGRPAPDFTLPDADGKPIRLSTVLREKAVLLNFWATWCPPCREEMPTMEQAYREYRSRGLEILAISIDAGEQTAVAARVKDFMTKLKLTFPALLDLEGKAVRAYRLRGLPTTFLIDRTGVIRAAEMGFRDWTDAESRRKLEALLKSG